MCTPLSQSGGQQILACNKISNSYEYAARHLAKLWLDVSKLGTHQDIEIQDCDDFRDWLENPWEVLWRHRAFPKHLLAVENILFDSSTSIIATATCHTARTIVRMRELGVSLSSALNLNLTDLQAYHLRSSLCPVSANVCPEPYGLSQSIVMFLRCAVKLISESMAISAVIKALENRVHCSKFRALGNPTLNEDSAEFGWFPTCDIQTDTLPTRRIVSIAALERTLIMVRSTTMRIRALVRGLWATRAVKNAVARHTHTFASLQFSLTSRQASSHVAPSYCLLLALASEVSLSRRGRSPNATRRENLVPEPCGLSDLVVDNADRTYAKRMQRLWARKAWSAISKTIATLTSSLQTDSIIDLEIHNMSSPLVASIFDTDQCFDMLHDVQSLLTRTAAAGTLADSALTTYKLSVARDAYCTLAQTRWHFDDATLSFDAVLETALLRCISRAAGPDQEQLDRSKAQANMLDTIYFKEHSMQASVCFRFGKIEVAKPVFDTCLLESSCLADHVKYQVHNRRELCASALLKRTKVSPGSLKCTWKFASAHESISVAVLGLALGLLHGSIHPSHHFQRDSQFQPLAIFVESTVQNLMFPQLGKEVHRIVGVADSSNDPMSAYPFKPNIECTSHNESSSLRTTLGEIETSIEVNLQRQMIEHFISREEKSSPCRSHAGAVPGLVRKTMLAHLCDERAQWSTALHDIPARMKVFIGGASFKLRRKSRANSWRLAEREISLSTFEFSQISMRSIAATNMNLTHDLLLSLCGQPSTKMPVHASGRHEQRHPPLPKARVLLEHREQVRTPCELLDKVNSEKLVAAFLVIDVCAGSCCFGRSARSQIAQQSNGVSLNDGKEYRK